MGDKNLLLEQINKTTFFFFFSTVEKIVVANFVLALWQHLESQPIYASYSVCITYGDSGLQ